MNAVIRVFTCSALLASWTQPSLVRLQTERPTQEVNTVPKNTADLLTPILDLVYESVRECGPVGKNFRCPNQAAAERYEARWKKVERLLARLENERSKPADEALVVLLHYYIGEATGTDLMIEVTGRGKRELPYLISYRNLVPQIPGRDYPASMLNDREYQKEQFDQAIQAIKSGKVFPPDVDR